MFSSPTVGRLFGNKGFWVVQATPGRTNILAVVLNIMCVQQHGNNLHPLIEPLSLREIRGHLCRSMRHLEMEYQTYDPEKDALDEE